MGEGECEVLSEEQPRKPRHRKKFLYNTILHQMEFYFSDSNLSKDRFLSQLLSENSQVDIDVFLKFNKIRKLNCTVEDIRKAINKSEIIGLSEDGLKVYRKSPIKIKENVDLCTIYVENIKADFNHESLSQIFSDFGNVVYVSVPKYKHNKANKGFAFIEYETEEQAKEAISYFESIGCKIPSEKKPEELRSIATFEGEQQSLSEMAEPQAEPNLQLYFEPKNSDQNAKKRKLSSDEETENKKLKTSDPGCSNIDKDKKQTEEEDVTNDEAEDAKKRKKKGKEKRKNFIKELGMQVLSKKEWKKLRNNYLDLQRKKMKEFKQYLNRQKYGPKGTNKKNIDEMEEKEEHKEQMDISKEVAKLNFTPGVIVKLILPQPCMDVKKLKNDIKSLSSEIKFVDIPLPSGCEEVYIRFSDKEFANEFCAKEFDGEKQVLSGEEERNYWAKIETDRTVKFQKVARKQRGREKLLKKAEKESAKHLRFDDYEEI